MKKVVIMILTVIMALGVAACGGKEASVKTNESVGTERQENETTKESESGKDDEESTGKNDNEVYMESDPLPEIWYGEWVCVYSEAYYFRENEKILVKDFDNAVLYTELLDGTTYENNRWFCYDEDAQVIYIFNETPFDEDWIRDSYEIKKVSESEIVLARVGTGEEVRFEKNETSDI